MPEPKDFIYSEPEENNPAAYMQHAKYEATGLRSLHESRLAKQDDHDHNDVALAFASLWNALTAVKLVAGDPEPEENSLPGLAAHLKRLHPGWEWTPQTDLEELEALRMGTKQAVGTDWAEMVNAVEADLPELEKAYTRAMATRDQTN